MTDRVHVIGAGLVGSLAAIVLAQRGCRVTLYDRRPDVRMVTDDSGRSINLALTSRGLVALERVGLREAALQLAVTMRGRVVHDVHGATTFIPYGQREHEVIYSVSRAALNRLLLEKAAARGSIDLRFEHRCEGYDVATDTLTLHDQVRDKRLQLTGETIIATDGAGSPIRASLAGKLRNFSYEQDTLAHGYKELEIPALPGGRFAMEREALHIWPRQSFMLIALPNLNGSFTCTLFLAFEGAVSFAGLHTAHDVREFFLREFADAAALMPGLAEDFFANPTGKMSTVRCAPWHVDGRITLLGDAAHAIVPFFGQGMNCGFEDCTTLDDLLSNAGAPGARDWAATFADLQRERKPNADAIAALAVENFVEMRDTVADPLFQLKKQIGFELERRFPGRFIPRYSMVVFHPEIPYAQARSRGIVQDRVLDALSRDVETLDDVDWKKAQSLLQNEGQQ